MNWVCHPWFILFYFISFSQSTKRGSTSFSSTRTLPKSLRTTVRRLSLFDVDCSSVSQFRSDSASTRALMAAFPPITQPELIHLSENLPHDLDDLDDLDSPLELNIHSTTRARLTPWGWLLVSRHCDRLGRENSFTIFLTIELSD
ncbi:uncharacterized protein F4812DRAFT_177188 [Daldinia caldariorum]|uniref:uncharacterized protein n=1 Tax=Daldinia caldariorum TaxID=326644 RepID=UPI00200722BE|nr:uncharacterized protein F4812DRAFT_177188 [Daldinia caldariorum]KAI1471392.1 hypothetical protein F4812DRAFT_177188 [Daldinia caldariorum]